MSELDVDWAVKSLQEFIYATDQVSSSKNGLSVVYLGTVQRESDVEVAGYAHVAEKILDQVLPKWRFAKPDESQTTGRHKWDYLRDWCGRGIAELKRQHELKEKLGDSAPRLSATELHPWIWSGATSLWNSGHFREAVGSAVKQLNAETQNKVGRRDVSETDLFKQAFSLEPPALGKPRLRRVTDTRSQTFRSLQRGTLAFAEGIFAAIRNPIMHEIGEELSEQEALEYLAALSILARWVDESTIEAAP